MTESQMSDQPLFPGHSQQTIGGPAQQTMPVQTMPLTAGESRTDVQYANNLPPQSSVQQQGSTLQPVGNEAGGHWKAEGFAAGKADDDSGFRRNRPNTPEVTETGANVTSRDQQGTAHLTGNPDDGMKGSWLTQLIGKATTQQYPEDSVTD